MKTVAKPPRRWRSARVCPRCGSKASKLFHLNTGQYHCQICEHDYDPPTALITRETADLALSALRARYAEDAYENDGAAIEELKSVIQGVLR